MKIDFITQAAGKLPTGKKLVNRTFQPGGGGAFKAIY